MLEAKHYLVLTIVAVFAACQQTGLLNILVRRLFHSLGISKTRNRTEQNRMEWNETEWNGTKRNERNKWNTPGNLRMHHRMDC